MAQKPVISTTQSVLGFLQWQLFNFQPGAIYAPTTWLSSALPPGVTMNASSGLISGACSAAGVYVVSVRAVNSAGASDPVFFTFGIEASSPTAGFDIDITIDTITGEVTPAAGIPPTTSTDPTADPSLGGGKLGDDRIFSVQFIKGGFVQELPITTLACALKEFDTDAELTKSTAWQKVGTGESTRYRVYMPLSGDALKGALSNYESDKKTAFAAKLDFEWVITNAASGSGFGPATLRNTSETMRFEFAQPIVD